MDSSTLSHKFASYSYGGVPMLTYGLIGLSVVFVGTAYGLNIMDTNTQGGFFSGGSKNRSSSVNKNKKTLKTKNNNNRKTQKKR